MFYPRKTYRGFYLEVEEDREEDCIKRFHYAVSTRTGKWYPIYHSPYSSPSAAEFQAMVDELALEDFVLEGRKKETTS